VETKKLDDLVSNNKLLHVKHNVHKYKRFFSIVQLR